MQHPNNHSRSRRRMQLACRNNRNQVLTKQQPGYGRSSPVLQHSFTVRRASSVTDKQPNKKHRLATFGLFPAGILLYSTLMLTYDLISGYKSWPIYLPGIFTAAAVMVVLSGRRVAHALQESPRKS